MQKHQKVWTIEIVDKLQQKKQTCKDLTIEYWTLKNNRQIERS